MSLLSKLIRDKGFKKIGEGTTGSEIYINLNELTGNFDLVIANEGSKFFKEFELNDDILDKLFSLVYKDYKYVEKENLENISNYSKYLEENENYKILRVNLRNIKDKIHLKKESLIKVDNTDFIISLMTVLFVNEDLADVNVINLDFTTTAKITDYIVKLAKQQEKLFKENNKGEDKNV